MALIKINKDGLMPINQMWRLILRRIFDEKHASPNDQFLIENNIEKWMNIVGEHNGKLHDAFGDLAFQAAVGRRGSLIDEIEFQLIEMSKMLVADEKGDLEEKKATFRNHGIDYRKT